MITDVSGYVAELPLLKLIVSVPDRIAYVADAMQLDLRIGNGICRSTNHALSPVLTAERRSHW